MDKFIDIKEYDYPLPEERIAVFPLEKRDSSKLLVYNKGVISHQYFYDLPDLLPLNTLLVRNITKVVQARLLFARDSGGIIEVFCLEPLEPNREMSLAMQQKSSCIWKCMAKLKKWKTGEKIHISLDSKCNLSAELLNKDGKFCEVKFTWTPENLTWAEVLDLAGKVPLPPYIHREVQETDKQSYQTIYAKDEGAVAAPTAGLHFSEDIEKALENKGIETEAITLHVSAGTFQPVEAENALNHPMHREQIIFERDFIEKLTNTDKQVICVGTTSLRALESLYWYGAELAVNENSTDIIDFFVHKMQPYAEIDTPLPSVKEALNAILTRMDILQIKTLTGSTEIFIFPGYQFRMAKGLITNFHQPQSTLLLLVSALVGEDWKNIYHQALTNDYRFLSYGDSSLLIP